jgi:hypothetical protein
VRSTYDANRSATTKAVKKVGGCVGCLVGGPIAMLFVSLTVFAVMAMAGTDHFSCFSSSVSRQTALTTLQNGGVGEAYRAEESGVSKGGRVVVKVRETVDGRIDYRIAQRTSDGVSWQWTDAVFGDPAVALAAATQGMQHPHFYHEIEGNLPHPPPGFTLR